MEGPMHYRPSGGPINGSSPKLVYFPRISNDSPPLKREATIATSRKYHRSFFEVFPLLRSKRHERPILIKSDPDPPQKKAPLKPIIQRHVPVEMQTSMEASPYNWPHDESLDPKTTALVIIDMQKDCRLKFFSSFCRNIGSLQVVHPLYPPALSPLLLSPFLPNLPT